MTDTSKSAVDRVTDGLRPMNGCNEMDAGAEMISALAKDRDEFEAEGIELNRRLNDALNGLLLWQSRAEKAEAEVERLREMLLAERALSDRLCGALEYIDDYCLSYPDLGVLSGAAMPAIQDHEQAALQRKEGNE